MSNPVQKKRAKAAIPVERERVRQEKMLEQLNRVYGDHPDPEEQRIAAAIETNNRPPFEIVGENEPAGSGADDRFMSSRCWSKKKTKSPVPHYCRRTPFPGATPF